MIEAYNAFKNRYMYIYIYSVCHEKIFLCQAMEDGDIRGSCSGLCQPHDGDIWLLLQLDGGLIRSLATRGFELYV